jgi:hypothetical protein
MGMLIPFLNELIQLCAKLIFGFKIRNAQAFALEDTEPLFHLIHPGAVHWREVHDKAWMMSEPFSDLFPMMCTDIVAHQMNRADALVDFYIHRFEKGHEFPLSLPLITVPVDPTRTGIKGGKEIERPRPLVLMLHAVGRVGGLGWQGRGRAGPRL